MKNILFALILVSGISLMASAETVQIYFNTKTPQLEFAANDIKAALEFKNFKVEFKNI